jgi:hypothetical protein
MLIIKFNKSCVSIIEDNLSNVAIWFKIRFMKINRHVIEINNVVEFMFSLFDDSRQDFVSFFNLFDLIRCSFIILIELNDVQHDVNYDAIKFEIIIDSNIMSITKISQIVLNFEIQLIKVNCDSIFEFVMNDRS